MLQEVWREARGKSESFIRGVCGAFLFSNDAVEKPISVLSGGERASATALRVHGEDAPSWRRVVVEVELASGEPPG